MPRLVPMPDPQGPAGSALVWVNVDHITTAVPVVDRAAEPFRLFVELKLQGHPVSRYWLAKGTPNELDAAWSGFIDLVNGG